MPTKYTTPAQDALRIRTTLKAMGITSRQVSVRSESYSMGSSLHINIHDPAVDIKEVQNIAKASERIDRDQWGDILCGGNRLVDVQYSEEAIERFAAEHATELAALINKSRHTGSVGDRVAINGEEYRLMGDGDGDYTLYKNKLGTRASKIPEYLARTILHWRKA